ncbi:MAG: hypothetical protein RXS23_08885 [Metallosphaera yellowstonensis]
MARRTCQNCKQVVDEVLTREGNKVTKSCPRCGYTFVSYEVGKGYIVPPRG